MNTEAEVVGDLVRRGMGAQTVNGPDGRAFLVTPHGAEIKDVSDEHGLKLTRAKYIWQHVTLQTAESLADYVTRFKKADTLLFADIAQSEIAGIIDYHAPSQADHCAHRATMKLPFSQEWASWTAIHGKLMLQLDFARFIEENAADIAAPSGGDLLDAVRDLQAHRKVNFTRALRTSSDNENFEYTDETEARTKGGIELPTKFQLLIPVYFGEAATEVFAFLRWKLDDGNLTLGVVLHRAEHIRQAVFRQIMLGVAQRTGCPVMFGKPA